MQPTAILPAHLPAILALNQRFAGEMAPLTAAQLDALVTSSVYARCMGTVDGFLVAFDQNSDYDGENFRWFKARFERFLYVDRIAVDPTAHGRGIAKALYADCIAWAVRHHHTLLTCEINTDPPNPASAALHSALGFRKIGSAQLDTGAKTVAYLANSLVAS